MSNYPGTIFSDSRTIPVFLLNVGDKVRIGTANGPETSKIMVVIAIEDNGAPTMFLTLKPENGAIAYRVEVDQDTPADVLYA